MIEYFFGALQTGPEIQLERLVRRTRIVKQTITCIVSGTYNLLPLRKGPICLPYSSSSEGEQV